MLESCDIVGVNPLEWLTHMLNNLHYDTPPSKSSNCYHTTTKSFTNNPREIFSPPAERLVSDAYLCGYYSYRRGPNVVCSTIPGNAKSSVRGTDNKEIPTLEPKLIS